MVKFYELDHHSLWHIKHTNNGHCSKCDKPFKEGDTIVRMGSSRKDKGRYVHRQCYNALFIEV
jgi:hypothetical protein